MLRKHVTLRGTGRSIGPRKQYHVEGTWSQSDRSIYTLSLRGAEVAIGPREHVTSRGFEKHSDPENTSPRGVRGRNRTGKNTSLRGVRVAIGPGKHVTSRGPSRNRAEKTRHFQGSGSLLDKENTSRRGVRVAIGPTKHVTSRGRGRHRTEKTRHIEGPGSRSGRENIEGPGPGGSKGGTTGFSRKVQSRIVGLLFFTMKSIPSNSESPPGEPGRLRRGDSFIFARGSVGPGPLETFRGAASGILGDRREFSIYIYIYIYICIYILNSRRSPKIPDAAPRNVSSGPGPTLPLAKMNESPRRSRPCSPGGDSELDGMDFILKKGNPTMRLWTFRANPAVPPLKPPGPGPSMFSRTRVPRYDVFSQSDGDLGPSK